MKKIFIIFTMVLLVFTVSCDDYMEDLLFQAKLTEGLVAYWPVMGTDNTGLEYDYAGNNNLNNAGTCQKVAGKFSTAIEIPSGGGYISCSAFSFSNRNGITLTGWFRMYGARGFSINLTDGVNGIRLFGGPNYTQTSFEFSTSGNQASTADWNFINTWKYFSGTYDGETLLLYIDGMIVGSFSSAETFPVITQATLSGDCLFDEVRIYNRALSQKEIEAIMDMGVD